MCMHIYVCAHAHTYILKKNTIILNMHIQYSQNYICMDEVNLLGKTVHFLKEHINSYLYTLVYYGAFLLFSVEDIYIFHVEVLDTSSLQNRSSNLGGGGLRAM